MKKSCEVCGEEFEAVRSTSRYCGPTCRKQANRVSVTGSLITDPLSVTSEAVSVTNVEGNVPVSSENVPLSRVSVTNTPEIPLESVSIPQLVRAKTSSVTSRDDIWSEDYDTSEAGFKRRNKNWPDFKPQFRADTIEACKRINKNNLSEVAANAAMRVEIEAKSAVRGEV